MKRICKHCRIHYNFNEEKLKDKITFNEIFYCSQECQAKETLKELKKEI